MSYSVTTIKSFEKNFKQLMKKYKSLTDDIQKLGELLKQSPTQGTALGGNCYKIRMQIASKSKGKSGGARVITYVYVNNKTVYLLSIYDKAEQENISPKELEKLLKEID
jgi:mRNA-degrading endonuclease RelE of RelBE toxin-antitoxin system